MNLCLYFSRKPLFISWYFRWLQIMVLCKSSVEVLSLMISFYWFFFLVKTLMVLTEDVLFVYGFTVFGVFQFMESLGGPQELLYEFLLRLVFFKYFGILFFMLLKVIIDKLIKCFHFFLNFVLFWCNLVDLYIPIM